AGPPGRSTQNNALGAAFGPDGRYLWYARHRGGFGYNLDLPEWELAIYDRQTGKVFNQTDLYGSAMRPVLSPDGTWLVHAPRHDAETGLRLRNLSSGDERWLVYPVQRDDQESRFTRDLMPGSSFTPDSKALVVSYGGKIWRVEVPSGQASPIPFTAKVHQDLGPLVRFETRVDTGDVLVKQIRDASPSPDGKRLAFTSLDKLDVMDLPAGGAPTRITPISGGGRPHFSRDPNRIYLYEANEGLVSVRYDGTDRRVHIKVTGFTPNFVPNPEPFPADEVLIAPDSSRVLATS